MARTIVDVDTCIHCIEKDWFNLAYEATCDFTCAEVAFAVYVRALLGAAGLDDYFEPINRNQIREDLRFNKVNTERINGKLALTQNIILNYVKECCIDFENSTVDFEVKKIERLAYLIH